MADKKPKYHFEGKKKDAKGSDVYVVIELKTGKVLEWNETIYKKYESEVEK